MLLLLLAGAGVVVVNGERAYAAISYTLGDGSVSFSLVNGAGVSESLTTSADVSES